MALDTKLPNSLAAAFGYVDTLFSLLALEEDTLSRELQKEYQERGVPLLDKNEIFTAENDLIADTQTPYYIENEFNYPLAVGYQRTQTDIFSNIQVTIRNGVLLITFENGLSSINNVAEITIFSLSGKLLKNEVLTMLSSSKELKVNLSGIHPQTVVLRVMVGGQHISKMLTIPSLVR